MYSFKAQQGLLRDLLESGGHEFTQTLKLSNETLASGSPTGEASVARYTGLAGNIGADVLPTASAHSGKLLVVLNLDDTYTVDVAAVTLAVDVGVWVGFSDGTAWRQIYTNGS